MADKKAFDLGDYVEVKERIARFYDLFGQGARLVTGEVRVTSEPDGKPRVWVQGRAYRTPDDPLPGTGWSWMELPGTTTYTRGSELENTETSAWGRAIGALGILIDRSIATGNEVRNKATTPPESVREPVADPAAPVFVGQYAGTGKLLVRRTGPADGLTRQGPEGPFFIVAFDTVEGKTVQVRVDGTLTGDIYDAAGGSLDGLVCTIEGDLYRIPWTKEGKAMPPFQRVVLRRIVTQGWTLPEPTAPSVAMFDEADLDAALERVP